MLLQLSPGFSPRSNELSELDHLISLFKNYKLAIEFRNKGWVSDSRLEELNEFLCNKKVTFVGVDAPDTEHFMAFPYLEMVTNPALAYLRCHGRNAEGYVKGRALRPVLIINMPRKNYARSREKWKRWRSRRRKRTWSIITTPRIMRSNRQNDFSRLFRNLHWLSRSETIDTGCVRRDLLLRRTLCNMLKKRLKWMRL